MTPNKANIRKWVRALRSGKFKQATGQLRKKRHDGTYSYCCLGVAEVLRGADEHTLATGMALTSAGCAWLGISDHDPDIVTHAGVKRQASSMNDEGSRFPAIANAIERTYLKPKKGR